MSRTNLHGILFRNFGLKLQNRILQKLLKLAQTREFCSTKFVFSLFFVQAAEQCAIQTRKKKDKIMILTRNCIKLLLHEQDNNLV